MNPPADWEADSTQWLSGDGSWAEWGSEPLPELTPLGFPTALWIIGLLS